MPKMKCPANCDSVSVEGEQFEADENGFVDVPEEAVSAVMSHGFTAPTLDELKAAAASKAKK